MKIRPMFLTVAAMLGLMGQTVAGRSGVALQDMQTQAAPVSLQSPQIPAKQSAFATVTRGEKASVYVLTAAMGIRGCYLSADGRFVGGSAAGGLTDNLGFVYDIARDTLKVTTAASFVKDWQVYAGHNTINRNGQLLTTESLLSPPASSEQAHASIWAASASLDTVVTLTYRRNNSGIVIYVPCLVDGKTGKALRAVEPHWPLESVSDGGLGARVNGANNDATVLVGHTSKPGGANWAPIFWDLKADTSFFAGIDDMGSGSLSCVNNDGTLIGGTVGNSGVVIRYDRAHRTYDMETLPMALGKDACLVEAISETGLVLYVQYTGVSSGSRESYLYDLNDKTMVSLKEYVGELYGLDLPVSTFTALSMSDDGRKITGWTFAPLDVPYLIVLDENQIFAKPRRLNAFQAYGEMNVRLSWSAPLKGQYTLKGYNVYCDSVKLNADLIDKAETTFEHTAGVRAGEHAYTVQAVYEEGVSDYCAPMHILVIADDDCLPVQEIGHHLTYNRSVEVYWGLPSAQISRPAASAVKGEVAALTLGDEADGRPVSGTFAKSYTDERLDLISYKNFGSRSWASALLIDNRLYASKYNNGTISIFDPYDMSLLETHVFKLPQIANMVYQDGNLYLATGQEEIVVVNLNTMTVSNRLKTKAGIKVRHIAYIPSLDGGKGGFAYGDWTSLQYCDRYGRELTTGVPEINIKDIVISGSVYHKGKLYLSSQTGKPYKAEIYTVDFESGSYVNKRNIGEIRRLADIEPYYGFAVGGLSLSTLDDGTLVLASILQFSATYGHVAFLELESAPDLLGYNLYRSKDGATPVRLNAEGEYIRGLSYSEDLTEPGTYTYTVEAVSEGGCIAMLDDVKTNLTIEPVGECAGPAVLQAYESAKAVCLNWSYVAGEGGPTLLGFNIYRNDELLVEHMMDVKYTDVNMAPGDYTYRVEAFYNNSCSASKEAAIKVTHEGRPMPPAHFDVSSEANAERPDMFDVKATWDLPYYESPLAIGYGGMPYNGIALKENMPIYALIGWDTAGLQAYKNLYVVGIEYFIGFNVETVDGLVYLNDTLAYTRRQSRIQESGWNTLMFDRYFSMNQPQELLVGYKVTYNDDSKPVAVFDAGPGITGYGDWISGDGQRWSTLKDGNINGNWCINALVVDKRDLEAASVAAAAGKPTVQPVVRAIRWQAPDMTEPQPIMAPKSSSASVKLQGFNIYRDGEKLNETPLQGFAYTDKALPAGDYEYEAEAVYANSAVKGNVILIQLGNGVANEPETLAEAVRVFPNPARLYFRVQGDYTALEINDMSGKTLRRYTDGRSEIDASGLKSGLYVLRFTLPDGTQRLQKIVLE